MERLFNATSVAIVGASRNDAKWGGRVLTYMRKYGFKGTLTLVNPKVEMIAGIPTVGSAAEVGPGVDLAVVTVPASAVPEAITGLGEEGVPYAVVLTSGFGPAYGTPSLQDVQAAADSAGVRICGPNSVGIANVALGLYATAASNLALGSWDPGGLSIVSQSGAVGLGVIACRAQDRGLGLNKLISTGNELDITCAEAVEYLATDVTTLSIGLYLEGANDGRRLATAVAGAVENGKSVAILKGGMSKIGALTSSTHTGLAAGSGAVFRSVLKRAGATWCSDIEELLDHASLHQPGIPDAVRRVAVISTSGGMNILAADALAHEGIVLPTLRDDTQESLGKQIGPLSSTVNPVDVAGPAVRDMGSFAEALRLTSRDSAVDLTLCVLSVLPTYQELASALKAQPPPGPLAFVNPGGSIAYEAAHELQTLGHPVFASISAASVALGMRRKPGLSLADRGSAAEPDLKSLSTDFMAELTRAKFGECVSDAFLYKELEAFGIPCAAWAVASSQDELRSVANRLPGPWVIKALSTDIQHRTDVGAVLLRLRTLEELQTAFKTLQGILRPAEGGEKAVLVQSMVEPGVETIVGGLTDDQFGAVVSVGVGGVVADLYKPSLALAPLGTVEAERVIHGIDGRTHLDGYRGGPETDVAALAAVVNRVGMFCAAVAKAGFPFTLDLNPVIVHARGAGVTAVDAVLHVLPVRGGTAGHE